MATTEKPPVIERPADWLFEHIVEMLLNRWPKDDLDPAWFDVIAATRGWLPLKAGEEMTVHVGGKEFVVKRTE